jgi:hypothetical protein
MTNHCTVYPTICTRVDLSIAKVELVKYAIARSFFINSLQKKGDTPHPQEQY